MNNIQFNLYSPDTVARFDRLAIESGIHGFTLMRRAGQAIFDVVLGTFPDARTVLVVCGAGNNAGDGYVVARLAHQHGIQVSVVSLTDTKNLKGDALQACQQWLECGELSQADTSLIDQADVVVDALLGTGLVRDVDGNFKTWIDAINARANKINKPVISVDVPSGLDSLTGAIRGAAVRANITVSFIGLKSGLFTGSGKACCGEVVFNNLDVPDSIYNNVEPSAILIQQPVFSSRAHDSHKGDFGHVLVIGGNYGMPGAVVLAGKSALRSGAGLVSVVTREQHIAAVTAHCPELMVYASQNGDLENELPSGFLDRVSHVIIGPGLGVDAWARRLLAAVLATDKPVIIDADALNLLAEKIRSGKSVNLGDNHVITPHPGEAARLLSGEVTVQSSNVQADRFTAARQLYELLGGVVVLKGSGTLVYDGKTMSVCPLGNPAMATAGMGDVLSGVIAAQGALGLSLYEAACAGVYCHAEAGDRAAATRPVGLLASDVIDYLPSAMAT